MTGSDQRFVTTPDIERRSESAKPIFSTRSTSIGAARSHTSAALIKTATIINRHGGGTSASAKHSAPVGRLRAATERVGAVLAGNKPAEVLKFQKAPG